MKTMLEGLEISTNLTRTENGAITNGTTGNACLNLFFRAGAMRHASVNEIHNIVDDAMKEDESRTLKILFFVRDVRGGLGERRFFKVAISYIAEHFKEALLRNISYVPEYGRWDDLLELLDVNDGEINFAVLRLIRDQLYADSTSETPSLIAKWLPSINTSSNTARFKAKRICKYLQMDEKTYRKLLSSLRAKLKIIENNLREKDYTFDYSTVPSKAALKYRAAFYRNDEERYTAFLNNVINGKVKMNASTLYPYEIVEKCCSRAGLSSSERESLNALWMSLPSIQNDDNAIAVVDGSGSMTWHANPTPIDVAVSLGIYFAEQNKGAFKGHFITFGHIPKLVKVEGVDIAEKVWNARKYTDCSNTNLEATFKLILDTASKYNMSNDDIPKKLYIISDMEFDVATVESNNELYTLYDSMKKMFADKGYTFPQIIFWNVDSRNSNFPVRMDESGTALVSGCTPSLFNMAMEGEIDPMSIMLNAIDNERYAPIH